MPAYQTQGIILKKTARGEAGQLFSIYTDHLGKVEAVARGSKKIQSKLNSHLQFFSLIDLMIARGRNTDQLAGAQSRKVFFRANSELQKIILGSFILELVEQLTKLHQVDQKIFNLMINYLQTIGQAVVLTKKDCVSLEKKFIVEFLTQLGYQPAVEITANQNQLQNFLNQHLDYELKIKKFVKMLTLDDWLPVC